MTDRLVQLSLEELRALLQRTAPKARVGWGTAPEPKEPKALTAARRKLATALVVGESHSVLDDHNAQRVVDTPLWPWKESR